MPKTNWRQLGGARVFDDSREGHCDNHPAVSVVDGVNRARSRAVDLLPDESRVRRGAPDGRSVIGRIS